MTFRNHFFPVLLIMTAIFSAYSEPTSDIMDNYRITSTFGDTRNDHFHTGIDMAGPSQAVRSLFDGQIIFTSHNRERSIRYGMGNFMIIQNKENTLRINYSHLDSINYGQSNQVKKNQTVATSGNSGYSSGIHLHFETEDLSSGVLTNPLKYIKIEDHLAPVIDDVLITDDTGKKVSLYSIGKIRRGGKIYIRCYDRIDNSPYFITPYKISLIINGKELQNIEFSRFKKTDNSLLLENSGLGFRDIYQSTENFEYYLLDYSTLPGVIGIKIIVEDFHHNKSEFKKALKVVLPDTL